MVQNSIKVFARLKKESAPGTSLKFDIFKKEGEYEDIVFYTPLSGNSKGSASAFRFHKVFGQDCEQAQIFREVVRPVIHSVMEGYNGTIFAYGQTGSGKTYSMTGSPKSYECRGIIPRTLECLFELIGKMPQKHVLSISYMEIYNEVGYDLLNPKQCKTATRLEEFPRIILMDDGKGEAHIRNLSVLPITTEKEAMRLLFLGDTNRTIAETPSNEYSSRSHSIFTVYLSSFVEKSSKIRYSKLNLIDLAGSERVHKTNVSGTALNEAKFINLSLHYLEQVIIALSENHRCHVPYRNSMMTYMLKDSLSGNCLTVMLTNLNVGKKNLDETISSCKFAQRVATVTTEIKVNEVYNPQMQVEYWKGRVEELQKQIQSLTGANNKAKLNESELEKCNDVVDEFLSSTMAEEELTIDLDLRIITQCFKLMKNKIESQNALIDQLKTEMQYSSRPKSEDKSKEKKVTLSVKKDEVSNEQDLFNQFMSLPENYIEIEEIQNNLDKKYEVARVFASSIENCQKSIIQIRNQLENFQDPEHFEQMNRELVNQQSIYRKSIVELKNIKKECNHLKFGLKNVELNLIKKFKQWQEEMKYKSESTPSDVFLNEDEKDWISLNGVKNVQTSHEMVQTDRSESRKSDSPKVKTEALREAKSNSLFLDSDSNEFVDFMKSIPLTGDYNVDSEIFSFYRSKFS